MVGEAATSGLEDSPGNWQNTLEEAERCLLDVQKSLGGIWTLLQLTGATATKESKKLREENMCLKRELKAKGFSTKYGLNKDENGLTEKVEKKDGDRESPTLLSFSVGPLAEQTQEQSQQKLPGAIYTPPEKVIPKPIKTLMPYEGKEEEGGTEMSKESSPHGLQLAMPYAVAVEMEWAASAMDLKGRIREAFGDEPSSSCREDLWKNTGMPQKIVRKPMFEQSTLTVIALYALWLWVDTDNNSAATLLEAKWPFIIAENVFCTIFTVEWIVRFSALQKKKFITNDKWLMFDSVLVGMMVIETWVVTFILVVSGSTNGSTGGAGDASVLRILRLLRLSRMARMAKLFRAVPELLVMIKGIVAATRSVVVTLTMLVLILYVFGITFRQMLDNTEPGRKWFATVPDSMLSLVFYGIILDGTPGVVMEVGAENFACGALLFLFILLASFTVLNMLIGVMCETVRIVSTTENERMTLAYTKEKLWNMLTNSNLDADGNNMISRDELKELLKQPDACIVLRDLGVDVYGLVDLADVIFENAEELDFPTFMQVVIQLRGCNQATVHDLIMQRKFMGKELAKIGSCLSEMAKEIPAVAGILKEKSVEIKSVPAFRDIEESRPRRKSTSY